MKPLELTVYPRLERPLYGHQIEGYRQQVKAEIELREAKRFTDAELAAEYYAQQMASVRAFDRAYPYGESEELDMEEARISVIQRFATLPHHDEPDHG